MAGDEAAWATVVKPPARPFIAPAAAGGVQAHAADDGKGVAIARIDGNPAAGPWLPEILHALGSRGLTEHASVVEEKGNRARAIVATIVKRAMSPAPHVGPPDEVVGRPDCFLHGERGVRRGDAFAPAHHGAVTLDHRSGLWRMFDRRLGKADKDGAKNYAAGEAAHPNPSSLR